MNIPTRSATARNILKENDMNEYIPVIVEKDHGVIDGGPA